MEPLSLWTFVSFDKGNVLKGHISNNGLKKIYEKRKSYD